MEEQTFKPIEEKPVPSNSNSFVEIPNLKEEPKSKETVITNLPKWSIEPPVEINRSQK